MYLPRLFCATCKPPGTAFPFLALSVNGLGNFSVCQTVTATRGQAAHQRAAKGENRPACCTA